MKQLIILLGFFIFSSCIPLRIAPTIKEDKVMIGKKFKRHLPKNYAFIFEDPKDADDFRYFMDGKYELDNYKAEGNFSICIDDNEVFLSFYEVEIPTKTLNLIPIFINASLGSDDGEPIIDEEISRIGHWYLALTVLDSNMEDCLSPNHKQRENVLKYLRRLRMEYLSPPDYIKQLLSE